MIPLQSYIDQDSFFHYGRAYFTDLFMTTVGKYEIKFFSGGNGEHDSVMLDSSNRLNSMTRKEAYLFKIQSRSIDEIRFASQPADSVSGLPLSENTVLVAFDRFGNVATQMNSRFENV